MELDEQLYDKHHELRSLPYAKLETQSQQLQEEVKISIYTIPIYLEKLENNHQKKALMLDSKNLGGLHNFLSPSAN